MSWSTGWGTWHVGDGSACPQGCEKRHTVVQAVGLNEAASERRRAALRAAHERWLGKEKPPDPKVEGQSLSAPASRTVAGPARAHTPRT